MTLQVSHRFIAFFLICTSLITWTAPSYALRQRQPKRTGLEEEIAQALRQPSTVAQPVVPKGTGLEEESITLAEAAQRIVEHNVKEVVVEVRGTTQVLPEARLSGSSVGAVQRQLTKILDLQRYQTIRWELEGDVATLTGLEEDRSLSEHLATFQIGETIWTKTLRQRYGHLDEDSIEEVLIANGWRHRQADRRDLVKGKEYHKVSLAPQEMDAKLAALRTEELVLSAGPTASQEERREVQRAIWDLYWKRIEGLYAQEAFLNRKSSAQRQAQGAPMNRSETELRRVRAEIQNVRDEQATHNEHVRRNLQNLTGVEEADEQVALGILRSWASLKKSPFLVPAVVIGRSLTRDSRLGPEMTVLDRLLRKPEAEGLFTQIFVGRIYLLEDNPNFNLLSERVLNPQSIREFLTGRQIFYLTGSDSDRQLLGLLDDKTYRKTTRGIFQPDVDLVQVLGSIRASLEPSPLTDEAMEEAKQLAAALRNLALQSTAGLEEGPMTAAEIAREILRGRPLDKVRVELPDGRVKTAAEWGGDVGLSLALTFAFQKAKVTKGYYSQINNGDGTYYVTIRSTGLEETPKQPSFLVPLSDVTGPVAVVGKLGGTSIVFQAATPEGLVEGTRVIMKTHERSDRSDSKDEVLGRVEQAISDVIAKFGAERVVGVYSEAEADLPSFEKGLHIGNTIQERLANRFHRHEILGEIPVTVVHDGTGGALGEGGLPKSGDIHIHNARLERLWRQEQQFLERPFSMLQVREIATKLAQAVESRKARRMAMTWQGVSAEILSLSARYERELFPIVRWLLTGETRFVPISWEQVLPEETGTLFTVVADEFQGGDLSTPRRVQSEIENIAARLRQGRMSLDVYADFLDRLATIMGTRRLHDDSSISSLLGDDFTPAGLEEGWSLETRNTMAQRFIAFSAKSGENVHYAYLPGVPGTKLRVEYTKQVDPKDPDFEPFMLLRVEVARDVKPNEVIRAVQAALPKGLRKMFGEFTLVPIRRARRAGMEELSREEMRERLGLWKGQRILLVDDQPVPLNTLKAVLRAIFAPLGFSPEVEEATSFGQAQSNLKTREYPLVIADFHLDEGHTAEELLQGGSGAQRRSRFILLTGSVPSQALVMQWFEEVLLKPVNPHQVAQALARFAPGAPEVEAPASLAAAPPPTAPTLSSERQEWVSRFRGLSHDLINALSPIAHAQLALMRLSEGDASRSLFQRLVEYQDQLSNRVRGLLISPEEVATLEEPAFQQRLQKNREILLDLEQDLARMFDETLPPDQSVLEGPLKEDYGRAFSGLTSFSEELKRALSKLPEGLAPTGLEEMRGKMHLPRGAGTVVAAGVAAVTTGLITHGVDKATMQRPKDVTVTIQPKESAEKIGVADIATEIHLPVVLRLLRKDNNVDAELSGLSDSAVPSIQALGKIKEGDSGSIFIDFALPLEVDTKQLEDLKPYSIQFSIGDVVSPELLNELYIGSREDGLIVSASQKKGGSITLPLSAFVDPGGRFAIPVYVQFKPEVKQQEEMIFGFVIQKPTVTYKAGLEELSSWALGILAAAGAATATQKAYQTGLIDIPRRHRTPEEQEASHVRRIARAIAILSMTPYEREIVSPLTQRAYRTTGHEGNPYVIRPALYDIHLWNLVRLVKQRKAVASKMRFDLLEQLPNEKLADPETRERLGGAYTAVVEARPDLRHPVLEAKLGITSAARRVGLEEEKPRVLVVALDKELGKELLPIARAWALAKGWREPQKALQGLSTVLENYKKYDLILIEFPPSAEASVEDLIRKINPLENPPVHRPVVVISGGQGELDALPERLDRESEAALLQRSWRQLYEKTKYSDFLRQELITAWQGDPERNPATAVRRFFELLKGSNPSHKRGILSLLNRLGPSDTYAVPALLDELGNNLEERRRLTAEILATKFDETTIRERVVPALIEWFKEFDRFNDPDEDRTGFERLLGAAYLLELINPSPPEASDILREILDKAARTQEAREIKKAANGAFRWYLSDGDAPPSLRLTLNAELLDKLKSGVRLPASAIVEHLMLLRGAPAYAKSVSFFSTTPVSLEGEERTVEALLRLHLWNYLENGADLTVTFKKGDSTVYVAAAGLEEGQAQPYGVVAVGGVAAAVPAGTRHVYAVTVGFEQTQGVIGLGTVSASDVVAVARGLEEATALNSLGVAAVLKGWTYPSLKEAKQAAIRLAQRMLEAIDGLSGRVLDAATQTLPATRAWLKEHLPSSWQGGLEEIAQKVLDLNREAQIGV